MGYILSLVAKKGEGNIVPYSTAKRVIEDSEADTVADFEDHQPMTIVSGRKFAENNPKTKEPFYHEIPQDEIQKRKDKSFVRYFLDGTRHIYKIGDLSIDGVIYPVSVGQIVICCCKRENRHMMHFDVRKEIVMSVPDTYCKGVSTKPALIDAYNIIKADYEKTLKNRRPRQRKVDFNQGVDARLFTPHMAKQFARIAISPLRIAFDDLKIKEVYIVALRMSVDAGIKNFSNYLLYNFNDKPSELYTRMEINVLLCDELNVNIYSFPMKYHPLYGEHSHDRNYIGKHWNKKYIRAIQAVLNSTKGMIGRGTTFFYKAFGNNESEYLTLLEMPDAMIVYRFFFEWLESKGHPLSTANWCKALDKLDEYEQQIFYDIIHNDDFVNTKERPHYSEHIDCALKFYINLRNEVAEPTGSLYSLKKEFDNTPKDNLQYIKKSGAVPVLKKYKAR